MERAKIDIWVGLLVALGIAALFGLATKVGNLTSNDIKETYTVLAYFENIGGLKPRAPVKGAGVVVGRAIYEGKVNLAEAQAIVDQFLERQ